MSSNLMKTEIGGEQTQYEGENSDQVPHKKSGGQLGEPTTTTDPSKADGAAEKRREQGEHKAENIRYGQTISEGGMSGFTAGQTGEADAQESQGDAREAAGYGGGQDMNKEVGA